MTVHEKQTQAQLVARTSFCTKNRSLSPSATTRTDASPIDCPRPSLPPLDWRRPAPAPDASQPQAERDNASRWFGSGSRSGREPTPSPGEGRFPGETQRPLSKVRRQLRACKPSRRRFASVMESRSIKAGPRACARPGPKSSRYLRTTLGNAHQAVATSAGGRRRASIRPPPRPPHESAHRTGRRTRARPAPGATPSAPRRRCARGAAC